MTGPDANNARAASSPEWLVKSAAYDVGFSLAGIAAAVASARSTTVYEKWIREERHGEMRYLSGGADKRKNPGVLLEGAKSVVCVGVNYYSRSKQAWNAAAREDGRGEVAMYAHGRDYHEVMHRMLEDLGGRIAAIFPGAKWRSVVDTEPISERDFAVRSGIAWLGKNTCVISPEFGSWIFLGELFTTIELEPDAPVKSLCGKCRKCLDACPTGALDAYFMDAKKCISYLTIEKRGDISQEFHGTIGRNLFGCDDCQRVCPFNDAARESVVFAGAERNALAGMKLEDLVDIGNARFKELACHTAIGRCKCEGMRRNARIVARNGGLPAAGG
jgi:epoxyqueuosine reductase